jgi:2-polyprenyl-6-methoxyphenol hydroxylase-like FAD-dependent oxidoreductase
MGTHGVSLETEVLIVGAGPVGLTLALDLAWRGIEVIVVERRRMTDVPNVKCSQISSRSMEVFRRLGIARRLRETGLPADYPNDVVSCGCHRDRAFACSHPIEGRTIRGI